MVISSEDNDDVVAKLIDFGYSCYGMEDEDEVQIGGTPLWSPPEHTGEKVTVHSAKKMDVYSFGLVCYWILFFDTISVDARAEGGSEKLPAGSHSRKNSYRSLERLKNLERPEEAISEIISRDSAFTEQQSLLLQRLLTKALYKSPCDRPHDWYEFMLVIRQLQGRE